ncbi:hypothetical protein [Priestia megaterium]|uniref:hypothetical protein n=1 Tax=Priestia megaterium TaxID=1404 RepID=UPI000BA5DD97|nr:hypothetical protein [Priestia megaterium]MBU8752410.1 hypothetical protein [Priestia megaterium]PAK49005.1 hypothetical protein CHH47_14765 [Priestia megaterium]
MKRLPIWIVFVGIIGGLLGFGALVDYIAKKRSIELDPEEGIKNASDAEQIYVENYLYQTKENNNHFQLKKLGDESPSFFNAVKR